MVKHYFQWPFVLERLNFEFIFLAVYTLCYLYPLLCLPSSVYDELRPVYEFDRVPTV